MKRLAFAAGLLAAYCSLSPSANAQGNGGASAERPVTLSQAYALSLAHMETIAQDKEAAKQALAHVNELVGDIMPQITGTASNLWEENPGVSIGGINLTNQPHAAITLNQILFSGFREFLAFKQGRRDYESANMTEKRAEQLLYQDVGQAYVSLLQARDQIGIDEKIVKAGQDQVDFLRRWVQIGRAKRSDLLTAESVLELSKAQLEQAHQTESAGQEMLKFLTDSAQDLAPEELPPPDPGDLKGWLAAGERRADVEAARDSYDAAQLQTKIISRQRWPTITATGNYYLLQSAFSKNVHYDGSVNLSVPLFTGGAISAQIREAQAQEKSAESGLSLALRTADENVRSSYRNLKWAVGSSRAFADAVQAAKKSFAAEKSDFEQNLVTNLDVMNSLTSLANTEVQANAARQQAAFGLIQLQVAAGEVPLPKTGGAP